VSRFFKPQSLEEALEAMTSPGARALAGGTDMMIQLRELKQHGKPLPELIVDLSGLSGLARLDLDDSPPFLGAGVSFRTLESHATVLERWPILSQAAVTVGSVQVRQSATIGGNIANASPAADGMSALTALGAKALVASLNNRRTVPLPDLITAPGKNSLQPGEVILGFELDPAPPASGQCFVKVGRRQAVAIARLNVAVALDENLSDPRFVLGACFPSPRRQKEVEDLIRGEKPSPGLWKAAGEKAADAFVDTCGWRSSAAYKVPAIARMSALALKRAWAGLESSGQGGAA
jgi:CO/xanthine dehydrogenase FAD-binding subunit